MLLEDFINLYVSIFYHRNIAITYNISSSSSKIPFKAVFTQAIFFLKAIDNFFFAKALLNRYYMWKNTSKNSLIFFLGTIFLLPRAKFRCIIVLCQCFRYYKAAKAYGHPSTWSQHYFNVLNRTQSLRGLSSSHNTLKFILKSGQKRKKGRFFQ